MTIIGCMFYLCSYSKELKGTTWQQPCNRKGYSQLKDFTPKDYLTAPYKTLTVDMAYFEGELADAELGDEERLEILEALWKIVCVFVDLDYEILTEETCGKVSKTASAQANSTDDDIMIERSLSNKFHDTIVPTVKADKEGQ